MKNLLTIILAMTILGCSGGKAVKKEDNSAAKMEAAKAAAAQAQAQMDAQLAEAKKENEEAKSEVDMKKEMLDKSKMEKAKVQERLVKMGFAAAVVRVTKNGDMFTYEDNSTRPALETVRDQELIKRLDQVVEGQRMKDNDAMDTYNRCSGGFQTCIDGRMYLLYMTKKDDITMKKEEMLKKTDDGVCMRTWYLVDRDCK